MQPEGNGTAQKDKQKDNSEKQQGFQQTQQFPLQSKQNKKQSKQQKHPFFAVPDAKPILSKTKIDMNKPKVLIRQIPLKREPIEILLAKYNKDFLLSDTSHLAKKPYNNNTQTTLWAKYALNQNYDCVYLKFYKGNVFQLMKLGNKKFRLELQKLSQYNQYVFSSYIIDFAFLSDVGTFLLNNLRQTSLEQSSKQFLNDEQQVQFDSRFQCGNLYAVFQKKDKNIQGAQVYQYDLILQTDINTKGYSNWFYFSIKSKSKKTLKFNLVNMQKGHSLFLQGMKVAVFSNQKFQKDNIQWHRQGHGFTYTRNQLSKNKQKTDRFSTLSFIIDQKYDDDLIYIAMNYPYSYSKLLRYIQSVQKIAKLNSHIYFKKQNLCKTISSNNVPVLTLTWKRDKKNPTQEGNKRKKIIAIIARQHPCETVSSFVVEGFINSLIYLQNENCVQLLQRFIFKIIPMFNIDGVVYGNSRCDINGNDVNRRWSKIVNNFFFPVISSAKSLFNRLVAQGYQIQHFFDLHGHSKKLGSFVYGCKNFDQVESRQFAWLMSKINTKFRFEQSCFGLSTFKRETARGSMANLVVNRKSTTLQTSFYGYKTSNGNKHFQIDDLHQLGQALLQALYLQQVKPSENINWQIMRNQIKAAISEVNRMSNQESSGSDSQPSVDQYDQKQRAQTFLDPQTAAKLGVADVTIANRSKSPQKQAIARKRQQEVLSAFHQMQKSDSAGIQAIMQQNMASQILKKSYSSQRIKPLGFRETKSVTKITPFKFTERTRKSTSDFKQRIRIAIDICHIKPQQKLSTPSLPNLNQGKSNKFWSEFNKEFQNLIIQKQTQKMQQKYIEMKYQRR